MRRTYTLLAICTLLAVCLTGFLITLSPASASDTILHNKVTSFDQIWSVTEGQQGQNGFFSVIRCQDGGYLATGEIEYQSRQSLLVSQIDESGGIIWRTIHNGYYSEIGREVIECQSGGFAVVGYTSENNDDALLIRLDSAGEVEWVQTYGQTTLFEQGCALVECQGGGFAFAGIARDANYTNSDFWLVRTDSQGTILWERFYGGPREDICYSMIETEDEGFVLVGSTKNYGLGNEDVWIIRTTSTGQVLWNRTFGGLREDVGYDIIQSSTGNYVIAGESASNGNQASDGFAAFFLNNGTQLWNTSFGGVARSVAYAITECADGGFTATGQTIEWDGQNGYFNLWLVRLGGFGEFLWSKTYGGHDPDGGRSILQTDNGDFIIAGFSVSLTEAERVAWCLRAPDIPPVTIDPRVYGPVNLLFIGLGTGLSVLVLLGSYLLFYQSRKTIDLPWTQPSRQVFRKSYLSPRVIEDIASILTGLTKCTNCQNISRKENAKCSKCRKPLHRCMFCYVGIQPDDSIIFCPGCNALAHHSHMLEWLTKRTYCPRCGIQLLSE